MNYYSDISNLVIYDNDSEMALLCTPHIGGLCYYFFSFAFSVLEQLSATFAVTRTGTVGTPTSSAATATVCRESAPSRARSPTPPPPSSPPLDPDVSIALFCINIVLFFSLLIKVKVNEIELVNICYRM